MHSFINTRIITTEKNLAARLNLESLIIQTLHFIRVSGRLALERTGEGAPQVHHARNEGVLVAHCAGKDGGQVVGPGAMNIPCQWVGGTERANDCQKQPEGCSVVPLHNSSCIPCAHISACGRQQPSTSATTMGSRATTNMTRAHLPRIRRARENPCYTGTAAEQEWGKE